LNLSTLYALARSIVRFASLHLRLTTALRAENLFLRRQLALYVERGAKPRRATDAERTTLALLARVFSWRSALIAISPGTLIRWQRDLARFFWRVRSRIGRPKVPAVLRDLIRRMHRENPLWGEERIANELLIKLGIQVSARTIRKYLRGFTRHPGHARDQRWSTFLKNHAREIVACDFVVSMTVSFRIVYMLVVLEIGSRRILHSLHHPSDRGVDHAATPRGPPGRRHLPLPAPRSRLDLLGRARRRCTPIGHLAAQVSAPCTKGQRLLRARHRHTPARMPRSCDPPLGRSSPPHRP